MKESQLVQAAIDVQRHAYAPYSNFLVGAAIRTSSGEVFSGCNVENASYGLAICAERAALCAMVAGGQREIELVAIASPRGVTPCGACRQSLSEFGLNYSVILVDSQTQAIRQRWSMQELLPGAFRLAP
ncbi:MAG: cytidine deaminase [Aureliella sp.]